MAGRSRSKNGVASLAYVRPSTSFAAKDVDACDKRGHDGLITAGHASRPTLGIPHAMA
jgi:hypothetical protein